MAKKADAERDIDYGAVFAFALGQNPEVLITFEKYPESISCELGTSDFSEHLRVALHLRHRSRTVLPALELIWRHLEVAKLLLILPHHAPQTTHLARIANATLIARGYLGGVEDAAKVPHVVAPSPNSILKTLYSTVFALPEEGSYHEQQRLTFQQILEVVEAPDARKETECPGCDSTGVDRRCQDQRVGLEDRLEVRAQTIFEGTDVRLRAEVGATAAGHEVKSAQIYESILAAALLQK